MKIKMAQKNGVVHSVFHPEHRTAPVLVANPGGLPRSLGIPQGQKIGVSRMRDAATRPGLVGKQARYGLALQGKTF